MAPAIAQARHEPQDDADVEAMPSVATPASLYHRLRVAEVVEETRDSRSIVFASPEPADIFQYRPGQFLTLRVPCAGDGPVARCYSLASAPGIDPALKVTVKRVQGGVGSNWLCDSLRAGDELEVLPPWGVFCPESLDADLLLFGGGSGITPIMSILKSCLMRGRGKVTLFYANRDESSVIFRDELRELASAHPDRLTIVHWLESLQGRPSRAQLAAVCRRFEFSEVFVCGPGPFMDAVEQVMADLGVEGSRVHVERFVSLGTDPGIVEALPRDDASGVPLEVTLDGEVHRLSWPRQVKLLDLLLAEGLKAPFSCREGCCSACMCQVTHGRVEMERNEILTRDDLDDGWVLACQARADSETVAVSFDGS